MNYLTSPYPDLIYDPEIHQDKSLKYIDEDYLCRPGCKLYCRLLKTSYPLNSYDKEIPQITLLSLILLHYKYITAEQFRYLMPWASSTLLSRNTKTAGKTDSEKSRSQITDGKTLRRDWFIAYSLDKSRTSSFYMLSRSAYSEMIGELPPAYLSEYRIPENPPCMPGRHSMHQVFTNNTPFRLLRNGSEFYPFRWITGVALDPDYTVEHNLELLREDSSFRAVNGCRAIYSKKPDGIIVTETTDRTYYCLLEQDMGTEKKGQLEEKHLFYAELLDRESDCSHITVLFNSANPKNVGRTKCRAPDHVRRNSYPHALAKLKYFMNSYSLPDIASAWFMLMAEESKSGTGAHNQIRSAQCMMSLLSDYMAARPDRPANDGTINDVEDFVTEKLNEKVYSKDETIYRQEKRHADTIRSNALEFILSNRGWDLRSVILYKGVSYIIANRIAFDRFAPVLLAKESAYAVQLFTRLVGTSLVEYQKTFRFSWCDGDVNGLRFRNTFRLSDGLPVTVFEEISNDVGGYLRAAYFSSCYKGKGIPMNMILLVSSEADARSFTRDTNISRFITSDPDYANWDYYIHVAFVDYTSKTSLPFIITEAGEKKVLRKFKKTKEVI